MSEIEHERLRINSEIERLKNNISMLKRKETQLNEAVTKHPNLLPSVRMINYVEFESSTGDTNQQREFRRLFKTDIHRILKGKTKRIELNKNHFEMYGFFETLDGKTFYFNTGDLRWFAKQSGMLIRTAKDFQDFTGGSNMEIIYDENFADNLLKIIN